MSKAQIVNQEKVDRFLRMFPPRIKQLIKQIQLVDNCSSSNYEWGFTESVPTVFIIVFNNLTETARKFGLKVDVSINGKSIEDTYEEANEQYQQSLEGS